MRTRGGFQASFRGTFRNARGQNLEELNVSVWGAGDHVSACMCGDMHGIDHLDWKAHFYAARINKFRSVRQLGGL